MIGKLLNLQAGHFKVVHVEAGQDALILILESRSKRCRCPFCHKYSNHIHSKNREIKQRGYNGARSTACLHFHEYVNRYPRFTPPG